MPRTLEEILVAAGEPVPALAECPNCHAMTEPFAIFEQPDLSLKCGQCMLDVTRVDAPAPAFTWDDFRAVRSQKLAACDWTQLVDVPVATRDLWQPYRDELRDAPATAQAQLDAGTIASLMEFEWPTPPGSSADQSEVEIPE